MSCLAVRSIFSQIENSIDDLLHLPVVSAVIRAF